MNVMVQTVQPRPPVPKDVDGGPDAVDDGEIRLAGEKRLPRPGVGEVRPVRRDEGAVSAADLRFLRRGTGDCAGVRGKA